MGLLRDRIRDSKGYRFPYNAKEFFSPRDWARTIKWRRQRTERGWSDRDTWGGGEYIMGVTRDILYELDRENNPIDWYMYFKTNYDDNYGYTSLSEVADDLDNHLFFEENQYNDEYDYLDNETRWAIEHALYEQAKIAMHFCADNIGGLWW